VLGSDLRLSNGPGWEEHPALAWNATTGEYLVVWTDWRPSDGTSDIYGRRVSAAGVPLAANFRVSGAAAVSHEAHPAVAWNQTANQYLVVWIDWRDAWADIYGRRVSAAGVPLGADFRISVDATRDEGIPDVVWNATWNQYLVVWSDTRAGGSAPMIEIYGQRVRGNGTLIGGEIHISGAGAARDELNAAVTWNGAHNQYLVVWQDVRSITDWDVYGRRLAAGGAPIGEDFRISSPDASVSRPDVAWNPDAGQYLVVWEDYRAPSDLTDLYGRRVRTNGAVVGASDVKVSGAAATSNEASAALAWSGTSERFLLVWGDQRNGPDRGWDIYGRRLTTNGAPTGGDFRICGSGAEYDDWDPALAWNSAADEFLVVWSDERAAGAHIYGRRVAG
jgi:hypothetical protein